MKNIILLCAILCITVCNAQHQKDSLLLADAIQIKDTLEMIFYLDKHASDYLIMTKEEQRVSNLNFARFYEANVKGENTIKAINIDDFLRTTQSGNFEYYDKFVERVYQRINEITISLINKYGFPSVKRLPNGLKQAGNTSIYVTFFDSRRDKELKKLLKKEYKLGNMEEKEYNAAMFFLKREIRIYTEKEKRRLFENTGLKIFQEKN